MIGAGITGLTAAHLLKQAGKTVALLEMSRIGYGATGYTTAKLAVGHSLVYAALTESYDVETASRDARSNQGAIDQVARIVSELSIECDFERASQLRLHGVERVGAADRARGRGGTGCGRRGGADDRHRLAVSDRRGRSRWMAKPNSTPGSISLRSLAPWTETEATYSKPTLATEVHSGPPVRRRDDSGTRPAGSRHRCDPAAVLDRGLFFAKAHPTSSYAIAAAVDESSDPRGMYISPGNAGFFFSRVPPPSDAVAYSWPKRPGRSTDSTIASQRAV